jgi:hypothetical protein
MKKITLGMFLFSMFSFNAFSADYAGPKVAVKDRSPANKPVKDASYEDSYHVSSGANSDRGIASEPSPEVREPSSVPDEKKHDELMPHPWLKKEEAHSKN